MSFSEKADWLDIRPGPSLLVLALPHTGTDIPAEIEERLKSPWLARKDTDWWVNHLYGFAEALGATVVRTRLSRTVIDVNRDPEGRSLYPGMATTELCPTTTFDGEALYRDGHAPSEAEIVDRRLRYFEPYHHALGAEIQRVKGLHGRAVLYDAHSIRSRIPRLFDGLLPDLNLGTNGGASCASDLTDAVAGVCSASRFSTVTNGRFKGGYTTRHHGRPDTGVHALQMELACRAYMDEPQLPAPAVWPSPFDPDAASPLQAVLRQVLQTCLTVGETC